MVKSLLSLGFLAAADVTLSEDNGFVESVHELATLELSDVAQEPKNQKQLRNSLFSLIREGFEQTEDIRMLPTCLHQVTVLTVGAILVLPVVINCIIIFFFFYCD